MRDASFSLCIFIRSKENWKWGNKNILWDQSGALLSKQQKWERLVPTLGTDFIAQIKFLLAQLFPITLPSAREKLMWVSDSSIPFILILNHNEDFPGNWDHKGGNWDHKGSKVTMLFSTTKKKWPDTCLLSTPQYRVRVIQELVVAPSWRACSICSFKADRFPGGAWVFFSLFVYFRGLVGQISLGNCD